MTDSTLIRRNAAAADLQWRAAPAADLAWYEADGEYVLYHRPSGKTHFVNAATHLLLRQILVEARDVADAASELARLQGPVMAEGGLTRHVAGLLLRFEELGLVERA